jgi:hypothetical protein
MLVAFAVGGRAAASLAAFLLPVGVVVLAYETGFVVPDLPAS